MAFTEVMFCGRPQPQFHLRIDRILPHWTTDPVREWKLTSTEKHEPDLQTAFEAR